jgi:transposase
MGSTRSGQRITDDQRRVLIQAYERDGNVRAAMRQAAIRSPRTAYLWIRRHREGGGDALQPRSRARKTQVTIPESLAAEIVALRDLRGWGRRRIAEALEDRHGRQVASPSGVEAVLRRSGRWSPAPDEPVPSPLVLPGGDVDRDRLVTWIEESLRHSLAGDARAAVAILADRIWVPLERARVDWGVLARDSAIGRLVLRSRVQLGHSLMNGGDWSRAARYLQHTLDWMNEHEPPTRRKQNDAIFLHLGLGWDNLWLECCQYLAIVERDTDPKAAQGYLHTALVSLRRSHQRRSPAHGTLLQGNIERDLGKLRVRSGQLDLASAHYRAAEERIERAGDWGMLAASQMEWALLFGQLAARAQRDQQGDWRGHRRAMERAIERAIALLRMIASPTLETLFSIDAARLQIAHGLPVDPDRLRDAAARCVAYGYRLQAQQLLALPPARELVTGDMLEALLALAETPGS